MLKIGEFSRLTQLSVATLRYYDQLGLLRPASIDPFTGYRYYSLNQLPRLNRILAFRDLGFSLEQIGQLLDQALTVAQLETLLRLKQTEVAQGIEKEQARLSQITARLHQIQQENNAMPKYEVVLKKIAPLLVASVRKTVPTVNDLKPLWEELYSFLKPQGIEWALPNLIVWHDSEQAIEAEVAAPLVAALESKLPVQVYTLPGSETMACVVHHGGYDTIGEAYTALYKWAATNDYQISGPTRQVHLAYWEGGDPASFLTELQFPVSKN